MLMRLPTEVFDRKRYVTLVALAFPLVGVFLVGKSLFAYLRDRKFRNLRVTLSSLPGVAGGRLKGQVQAAFLFPGGKPVDLTLSCVRSYVSSGNERTRWQRVLWQDRKSVTTYSGGLESYVPVEFTIPYDTQETNSKNPDDEILWRLSVAADLPGLDFRDSFTVPVFKTSASDPGLTVAKLEAEKLASLGGAKPADAKITTGLAHGGVQFYLGPARNKGVATALSLFGAVFLAGGLFFGLGVQQIFGWILGWIPLVVMGGAGLLLLAIAVSLWFGATTVEVVNRELHIRSTCLGFSSSRVVRAAEVQKLELQSNMQSGENVWYDLKVHLKSGRPVTAGTNMEKSEAEWFLGEIKKDLGV
jgi:hypothetical protein